MVLDDFPRQLARTRRFTLGVPRAVTISADGGRVLFLRTGGGEDPVSRLWLLDLTADDSATDDSATDDSATDDSATDDSATDDSAADGHGDAPAPGERLLADPTEAWNVGSGELPEAERIRRERVREQASGITAYSADDAGRTVAFALDGQLWVLAADRPGALPRLLSTAGPVAEPRVDPTGQRVAYVTDGALYVIELDAAKGGAAERDAAERDALAAAEGDAAAEGAAAADHLLAAPEQPEVTYGLPEHVAAESMYRYRGYWWAPDGRRLLVARVDNSPVQQWWIADPANPGQPPRAIRYPPAGTANADVSLHVLGVDGTRIDVDWDRKAFEYLTAAAWDANGPLLSVQSRDQRTALILAADPDTGATTTLHEERDPAWVQLTYGAPVRTEAGRLVRTGDLGDTRRLVVDGVPVTPDGMQVAEVIGADGETVYFVGLQDPTEEHLWRHDPERGLQRLSDGPGVHHGAAAGGTLVRFSRTEAGATMTVTRAAPPTERAIAVLAAEPLVTPRITWLTVGARQLRAALLLPSWYQAGTRLPVLMSPYGGPAGQLVLRARSAAFLENQWFAEHGFAVLVADGRGTPGRGPAWEKTIYGDALSAPVDDQADALKAVAERVPDLDLTKVAIRGWSFGGALAAMAVIRRPDVFHAAVSGAAPHDQRLYDTAWRERYLGRPDENPDAYDRSSTITQAAGLTRPLLLIHGIADDNVVAAHTLRMSSALLAAGRPHQVLPLSGATHLPTENTVSQLLRHQLQFLRDALGLPERQAPKQPERQAPKPEE